MAYNGSGTWVRLYNWTNDAANGIKIRADRMDAETNDMCNNGLSAVMTRDGQGSPSANIPWNGYNITGVGALSAGSAAVTNTATASIAANNTSGAAGNASSPCYIRCQQSGADIAIMGDAYDVIGSAFRSDDGAFVARNNLYLGCGAGKNIEIYQGTTQLGYFDASTGNFVSNYKVFGDAGLGITNGELTITGFGDTTTFDLTGSILTNSASGVEVQCVSGGVILNSGATSWAAVSDYRRKIDYGWFQDSGRVIDAVPVHLAQYKDGITARPMFLAHEVAQGGAGFAVKGEKDAVDDKGEPIYQTLESTDPLVAILWAEVRDLRKRLAALGG